MEMEKKCEDCEYFYECDNMGYFEECKKNGEKGK